MSAIQLKRLKLQSKIVEALEKQNIHTCQDVFFLSRAELLNALGINDKKREDFLRVVSRACCPSPKTAYNLYKESQESPTKGFLPTSLALLDDVLQGGILLGSITEMTGPPSVGKTQLCLQLCVLATLPSALNGLDGSVAYIDTESTFSGQRLKEIAESRFPEVYNSKAELIQMLQRVHVYPAMTTKSLRHIAQNLEMEVIRRGIKLIVLDSIASLLRKEFRSNDLPSVIQRNSILLEQAAILKSLAETFRIAVFVTNQITTEIIKETVPAVPEDVDDDDDDHLPSDSEESSFSRPGQSRDHVVPALGVTWSHCVSTRLVAEFEGPCIRQLKIVKSPVASNTSVRYTIDKSGLLLTGDPAVQVGMVDPHVQKIRTKSDFLQLSAAAKLPRDRC